ncbi:MAG: type 4a pilus biogenesis protein PilO [Nitrospirota bacterium]
MDVKLKIDIQNLSPLKKNLLLALPPVMIVVVAAVLFIMPGMEQIKQLGAEVEKQQAEITTLKRSSAKLPSLIEENKRLAAKLLELQQQLPEEKEVSGLLKQVSELGVKSGLQVALWKPRERSVHPSKEVHEIPVEVIMRGTYHRFGQFYSNITGLSRVVNIGNVVMRVGDAKAQQKNITALNVSFTAMTYSLLSEAERKELERAEKEKKR